MLTSDQLRGLEREAEVRVRALSKTLMDGIRPRVGPHAFFYQEGNTLEKLGSTLLLLDRLFEGYRRATALAAATHRIDLRPGPVPPDIGRLMDEERMVGLHMRMDFESLYVFGGVLLDQWSLMAVTVGGLNLPGRHPFRELVDAWDSGSGERIQLIWDQLSEQVIWLDAQLRAYRNRFVVHLDRPWQRGTTTAMVGEEFRLHTVTPPGWLDDAALAKEMRDLLPFAPKHIREADEDYWERKRPQALLERVVDNIGNVPARADRDRILEIYRKVGGQTPSFQVIGEGLYGFVIAGTALLERVALGHLAEIDLGAPHGAAK